MIASRIVARAAANGAPIRRAASSLMCLVDRCSSSSNGDELPPSFSFSYSASLQQQQQQQHRMLSTKRNKRQRAKRGGQKPTSLNDGNTIMFQSLGCPRNFVDTEVMLGVVLQAGMELTQDNTAADYLVLNTCGFLRSARDESSQAVKDLLRERKKGAKLLVTGCMVNLHADQIMADFPEVDHVLGAGSVDKILTAIQDINKKEQQTRQLQSSDQTDPGSEMGDPLTPSMARSSFLEQGDTPRFLATPSHYSYLKIAEGCRKRCSFCIIPKIKGRLQSKPIDQIVQEFKSLLDAGSKEVILIAQDLGDYGKDRRKELAAMHHTDSGQSIAKTDVNGLVMLLKAMLESDQRDYWLRLLYLYPDEITSEIVDVIEQDPRIVRYLDMPIQHINDTILKAMKRTTSAADIKSTLTMLRQRLPGMHIRTSLMVGFPGETEEQFQELLEFVKEFELDNVGAFIYSNEELAWSSKLPDHVPEDVKEDRYDRLMRAQLEIVRKRNEERIERQERLQVVVEGVHPEHDDLIVGRYYGQCPDIDGQIIINDVDELGKLPYPGERYWVELTGFDEYDLVGRIVLSGTTVTTGEQHVA